MTTAVLIVAAGRGSRLGAEIPKQYLRLAGTPILARTLAAFVPVAEIDIIQVVIHPSDATHYARCVGPGMEKLMPPVAGGATRQDSVRLGLEALAGLAPNRVLIHDAARPLVDRDVIARVLQGLEVSAGAIAALPVVDTLKRAASHRITATVDRLDLWRAQTPQGFRFGDILAAHRKAHACGEAAFTDDAQLAEWAGFAVSVVLGSEDNFKVTTEDDLRRAEAILAQHAGDWRNGTGFDVHRLVPGDHVWLCGVQIAHSHKLEGHSDADVGLHALTDAILGALGDGDIGQHFPPSDPQWKGAPSKVFLADAARRVGERGGIISNVDVTLLCEEPRIGPHRDAMRTTIAGILGIDTERVGVKATTTEGLGFTGRREGIAAMATATLKLRA